MHNSSVFLIGFMTFAQVLTTWHHPLELVLMSLVVSLFVCFQNEWQKLQNIPGINYGNFFIPCHSFWSFMFFILLYFCIILNCTQPQFIALYVLLKLKINFSSRSFLFSFINLLKENSHHSLSIWWKPNFSKDCLLFFTL